MLFRPDKVYLMLALTVGIGGYGAQAQCDRSDQVVRMACLYGNAFDVTSPIPAL